MAGCTLSTGGLGCASTRSITPPPPSSDSTTQAAGLNTVDVYVPWNLHEPRRGEFDFGEGNSQFSPFLNLTRCGECKFINQSSLFINLARFVEMIQEEDMLAIFR